MPEDPEEDPEGLDKPPAFFPYDADETEREPVSLGDPVEVNVEGVFGYESNGKVEHFVLLSDGDRKVPILIGPFEAQAITLPLDGAQPDRPMTHDLIRTIIDRLGWSLARVVIDDLWSATYYAKLHLHQGKNEIEIDCRPSDAIALAVRFDAPILVAEGILDAAGE